MEEEKRHMPELILLNIGQSTHQGDWNYEQVNSPFIRLYYCTQGTAITKIGNKEIHYKPDHIYILPPYTIYDDKNDSLFSHYYIHVFEVKTTNHLGLFDSFKIPFELKANEYDKFCFEKLIELNSEREIPFKNGNIKTYDNQKTLMKFIHEHSEMKYGKILENSSYIYAIISRFISNSKQQKGTENKRLYNAIVYIRNNINKQISTKNLSEICYLSEDYFIKLFKQEFKCTPIDYIRKQKIESAQVLLATTNMSVKRISIELAFNSTSYFHRVFKKITDLSPQEYRKQVCTY